LQYRRLLVECKVYLMYNVGIAECPALHEEQSKNSVYTSNLLIRLSAGLEDLSDIISDVVAALEYSSKYCCI
jgi:cystathionine beta-lyase/cystathionine gamma-synthase